MLNPHRSIWRIAEHDPALVDKLAANLQVDPILVRVMLGRGLADENAMKLFLNPSLHEVIAEFCPAHIDAAVKRVIKAIEKKEKVVVFGDYDADGVTGTVVVYDALKQLGADVTYYVPLRYTEGYGLNKQAVDKFVEDKVNLLITVDCGISNVEEIKQASLAGIDVIITDHHTPPAELPPALAIINPKCEHSDGSQFLAGVGVAYKFVAHLNKTFKNYDLLNSKRYLELVAIGTITDVVPLLGDNRIFVKKGIEKLNKEASLGLHYLLEQVRNGGPITTTTIGFGIGPRINAAGRLDSANLGIDLLMTRDRDKAKRLAGELHELNERRKREGEKIFQEATKIVEQNLDMLDKQVLVLSSEDWEPGVIGIVTSQLAKRYDRPVVLITTKGNISRGSIRSFAGTDIFGALEKCQKILLSYGGHKEAAGFEIDASRIDEFRDHYINLLHEELQGETLHSIIQVDDELALPQLTLGLLNDLKKLEPFGEGNREPVFLIRRLNAMHFYLVGKERSHLKVDFILGPEQIEAIGYKMSHYLELLDEHTTFDVAFNLAENDFGGKRRIILRMVDLKPSAPLPDEP